MTIRSFNRPSALLRLAPAAALAGLATTAVIAAAQQRGSGYVPECHQARDCPRTAYDGRFTFVRVYFDTRGGYGGFRGGRGEPPWHHDRPNAERNLSAIMREISLVRTFDGPTGGNVFQLDDPEIFRYPVLWMAEPGFWVPTDDEVESLRAYLLKGGFIIFDDFTGYAMYNLAEQMARALPELQFLPLDGTEAIFDSFFKIEPQTIVLPSYRGARPEWWGLFEDNDKEKRMLVVAGNHSDLGEYWEFSETGYFPVDLSNEAYKVGVNYIVFAMTH
jgi:hypothetical protein